MSWPTNPYLSFVQATQGTELLLGRSRPSFLWLWVIQMCQDFLPLRIFEIQSFFTEFISRCCHENKLFPTGEFNWVGSVDKVLPSSLLHLPGVFLFRVQGRSA